jgi:hypothetical protein
MGRIIHCSDLVLKIGDQVSYEGRGVTIIIIVNPIRNTTDVTADHEEIND